MSTPQKLEVGRRSGRVASLFDRIVSALSRHNVTLSLALVLCMVGLVGLFVIRDLQTANAEAENMYLVSVQGLRRRRQGLGHAPA